MFNLKVVIPAIVGSYLAVVGGVVAKKIYDDEIAWRKEFSQMQKAMQDAANKYLNNKVTLEVIAKPKEEEAS